MFIQSFKSQKILILKLFIISFILDASHKTFYAALVIFFCQKSIKNTSSRQRNSNLINVHKQNLKYLTTGEVNHNLKSFLKKFIFGMNGSKEMFVTEKLEIGKKHFLVTKSCLI